MTQKKKNTEWRRQVLRTTLPALLIGILSLTGYFLLIIPSIHDSLYNRKQDALKEVTNSIITFIEFNDQYLQGNHTEEAIRNYIFEGIKNYRYGPDKLDYVWIIDTSGVMLVHPHLKNLVGRNSKFLEDLDGKKFVPELLSAAKSDTPFVRYFWQYRADSTRILEKLAHAASYEEKGWVIVTGMYMEDIEQDIQRFTKKAAIFTLTVFLLILSILLYLSRSIYLAEKERSRVAEERENLIKELQDAFDRVRQLRGLLPICSSCKRIRNDEGYWQDVESYIADHSLAEFTHGVCPSCKKEYLERLDKATKDMGIEDKNNTETLDSSNKM